MTSLAPRNRAISRASRGTRNASGKLLRALREQSVRRRPHGALHTLAWKTRPIQIHHFQPNFCPSAGSACIHRGRFRTGFHSRRRARGGLLQSTARTSRSLLCKSGTVTKTATAATRPLSLVWRRLRCHSMHTLLRAMTLTHLDMTPGHAVRLRFPAYQPPFPSHTVLLHMWFLSHTVFHPRYARVSTRISPHS